jgi:DHA2 family multidrug resistance protein-like MFS transporter
MTSTDTVPGPRAGRREWIGLTVLLLPLLLVSMDVSVLYFAVPFISRQLAPTATQQLWIFDIYGFVLAGLLITMGALGDRIGRRRLLLSGAAAFGAASMLAAYAPNAELLIVARALLGVGGATLMPSTLALIRAMFHDPGQRGTAIAIWTAVLSAGVAVGPVMSGLLLEHFWWGSVFLVNTPVMALLLVLAPLLVPESKAPESARFDLLSAVLSLAAALPVSYGIKELAKDGYRPLPVAAIAAGLLVAVLFLRRQARIPYPMIDLGLLRRRAFGGSLLVGLPAMFAMIGFAIQTTQFLQSVLGMSPLEAALWSVLPSVAVAGAAPASVALARRLDRAYIVGCGFLVAAAGFAGMTRITPDSPLWGFLLLVGGYAIGLVVVTTQSNEMVMSVAPPNRAGAVSALLECTTEFGGALGMAILGSIGTAVYTRRTADALPAGLPAEVADAARETLAGAVTAAEHLPAATGEAVRTAAREAFTAGMHAAAIAAAVLLAASALFAVVFLRRTPVGGTSHPEPTTATS